MSLRLVPAVQRTALRLGAHLEGSRADHGLTQAEIQVLVYVHASGPCSIGDLHHTLGQKRSTLTNVLDRLVTRRLLERQLRRDDRRSFSLTLTAQGRERAKRLSKVLEQLEHRIRRQVKVADLRGFELSMAAFDRALEGSGS